MASVASAAPAGADAVFCLGTPGSLPLTRSYRLNAPPGLGIGFFSPPRLVAIPFGAAPFFAPALLSRHVLRTRTPETDNHPPAASDQQPAANFTSGLVTLATLPAAAGALTTVIYTDTTPAKNSAYYYRVLANGAVVGDASMANFPTMSADSVSNTAGPIKTYTTATVPLAPTPVSATPQAGPQVTLTWMDDATNETGFYVQRCSFVAPATTCSNFALIATVGPKNNTGNVTYADTTVAWGTTYLYQVAAFNGQGTSNYIAFPTGSTMLLPADPGFRSASPRANLSRPFQGRLSI